MNFSRDIVAETILDAVESNSVKHALALCEKHLKKRPNSVRLRSLKALTLWYSGKESESLQLASELTENELVLADSMAVTVIGRVLENGGSYELAVSLFERLLTANFDLCISVRLFFLYIRLHKPKKLYQLGCRLLNQTADKKYALWALTGLLLEMKHPLSGTELNLKIQLARRVVDRISHEPGEIQYNAMLVDLKIQVCLLCFDWPALMTCTENLSLYSMYSHANIRTQALMGSGLHNDAVNFCYKQFLDGGGSVECFRQILSGCPLSLSTKLVDDLSAMKDQRLYSLLIIEAAGANVQNAQRFEEAILDYLTKFSSHPSIFEDVAFYIKQMSADQASKMYLKCLSDDFKVALDLKRRLLRLLNSMCGSANSLPLPIHEISNENASLDDCLILVDQFIESDNLKYLVQGYHLLSEYREKYPDFYFFPMLQLLISLRLGLLESAYAIFKSLDIKLLQLDTIGYLLIDSAIFLLGLESCQLLLEEAKLFYKSSEQDTWHFIENALDSENMLCLCDFYEFSLRLENSIQKQSCNVQEIRLMLVTGNYNAIISYAKAYKFHSGENIHDNRDKKIILSLDPAGSVEKLLNQMRFFAMDDKHFFESILLLMSQKSSRPDYNKRYTGSDVAFKSVTEFLDIVGIDDHRNFNTAALCLIEAIVTNSCNKEYKFLDYLSIGAIENGIECLNIIGLLCYFRSKVLLLPVSADTTNCIRSGMVFMSSYIKELEDIAADKYNVLDLIQGLISQILSNLDTI